MPGRLTTHVLDTAHGRPAAGLRIELYRIDGDDRVLLASTETNGDGRTDNPLVPYEEFRAGTYEIIFHAGDYIARCAQDTAPHVFLDKVPVRFGMSNDEHYHVPLLLSPFGYSTYRGS